MFSDDSPDDGLLVRRSLFHDLSRREIDVGLWIADCTGEIGRQVREVVPASLQVCIVNGAWSTKNALLGNRIPLQKCNSDFQCSSRHAGRDASGSAWDLVLGQSHENPVFLVAANGNYGFL